MDGSVEARLRLGKLGDYGFEEDRLVTHIFAPCYDMTWPFRSSLCGWLAADTSDLSGWGDKPLCSRCLEVVERDAG